MRNGFRTERDGLDENMVTNKTSESKKKKRFFLNKIMKQLVVIVKASDGISSKTKKKKGSDPKNIFLAEFDRIWIRKKGRDSWKNQKET